MRYTRMTKPGGHTMPENTDTVETTERMASAENNAAGDNTSVPEEEYSADIDEQNGNGVQSLEEGHATESIIDISTPEDNIVETNSEAVMETDEPVSEAGEPTVGADKSVNSDETEEQYDNGDITSSDDSIAVMGDDELFDATIAEEPAIPDSEEAASAENVPDDNGTKSKKGRRTRVSAPRQPKTAKRMGSKPASSPSEKKQKKGLFIGSIIAMICALLIFAILTMAEDAILNRRTTQSVYVYGADLMPGTQLQLTDVAIMPEVDISTIPADAITDPSQVVGMYIRSGQSYKTIICQSQLTSVSDEVQGKRTLGISFNAAGAVNGLIRASDYIDLYIIANGISRSYTNPEDTSFGPYLEHVFVNKVFIGGSTQIQNNDTESFAAGIEITVPEEIADDIIQKISGGATVWATKCED